MAKSKAGKCQWMGEAEAFKAFATHEGKTESARHIKPLHWYVACRLVIEGGFHPDTITPRPPFKVQRKGKNRHLLSFDPSVGGTGEQAVLGGLKTKNVDVVVSLDKVGPVIAISCKGVTKSFRNLTNRMEETIGECTNLHITYPAMVMGYFALLRTNRTAEDVAEAPELDPQDTVISEEDDDEGEDGDAEEARAGAVSSASTANDLAINAEGNVVEGIKRFHDALRDMTGRRGIREDIGRYEAMAVVLVEPKGPTPGSTYAAYPEEESPLHLRDFFKTLYRRYDERFVYAAPTLVKQRITPRLEWAPESPALNHGPEDAGVPQLQYTPRTGAPE